MAYVEIWSPNKNAGNGGFKKSIIVVHTSEPGPYAPGKNPGTAAGLGKYLSNASVQASYHIAVDQYGDKCRMLADADRAWHAGSIGNNEGFAICAVGWSAWSREQWLSMPKMLDSMAEEIARWCKNEGIPANFVSSADLPKNIWGITGHKNTAEAWRQTDHTDPGNNFPYDVLINKVRSILNPTPQITAIQGKRNDCPWLGVKIIPEEERITPDGVGRYAHYENGSIYWTPSTGAQALSKEMFAKYSELGWETGVLKYPTSSVFEVNKGRVQRFQGGILYWSEAHGTHLVLGAIGEKYAANQWEQGFLGMPKTDEIILPDKVGIIQEFQGGNIYFTNGTGANIVSGLIGECYAKNDYEKGKLGYPKTDELITPSREGRYNLFEFGAIYYKLREKEAYPVWGIFNEIYSQLGYESGKLGFPTSNVTVSSDGNMQKQIFENGSIGYDLKNQQTIVVINGKVVNV